MPTEPERDIEKTLRAYSKKRREDSAPPGELHPATRRLLHGEVARLRAGKAAGKSNFWLRLLGGSWPQVAFNLCVVLVVMVAGVFLLLPSLSKSKLQSKRELAAVRPQDILSRDKKLTLGPNLASVPPGSPVSAQSAEAELKMKSAAKLMDVPAVSAPATDSGAAFNEPAGTPTRKFDINGQQTASTHSLAGEDRAKDNLSAEIESANKTPAPLAPPSSLVASTYDGPANLRKLEKEEIPQQMAKSAPVIEPPTTAAAPAPASASANKENLSYGVANNALPTAPVPTTVTVANSGFVTGNLTDSYTNSFKLEAGVIAQKFARAGQPTNLPRRMRSINRVILQSFRIEQAGDQIRIIDGDGSVYAGVLGQEGTRGESSARTDRKSFISRGGGFDGREVVTTNFLSLDSAGRAGALNPALLQYFRVSGTNRSLRLPVVFSGNLVPRFSNAIVEKSSASSWQLGSPSATSAVKPVASPMFNFQLQGQLLVGGSNQINIKAVPAKK